MSTATDPGGLPAKTPRGREAERLVYAETLQEIRNMQRSTTEFMERFQGRLINHVLMVATKTFPTSGFITENFAAPIGTVKLRNLSAANAVTIASATAMEAPPGNGIGIYVIPFGQQDDVAIGGTVVTFYGTAGDKISYQILTSQINVGN